MEQAANLKQLGSDVLSRAINSTVSPLIITDNQQPDNPIVYANQAFLDLCGYPEDEVVGFNCRFLQGKGTNKKTVTEIRNAIHANKNSRTTLKNYRKDGSEFWNDLVISPIIDEAGTVTHFIGMQLDITSRIERTNQLEISERSLRRSNAELEQFTYAASHDLQEPLRMVSSYLQLIKKRYGAGLDDDAQTFLDYATEGAERMQFLVNDLLTLSRVTTTAKQFKKTDITELVKRAEFNLSLGIEETGAQITIGDLPTLSVEASQIVQLLQNLIGNAIKYRALNRKPKISITAEIKGDKYILSVADNGIGIDPAYHERVFVIFQRLHTREEYPGTGVGLAICSKIIERHDGKLWVESSEDKGATFKFSLPINRKKA